MLNKKKIIKAFSIALSVAVSLNAVVTIEVLGLINIKSSGITSRNISNGIVYEKNVITYSIDRENSINQRINQISVNLNSDDLDIVFIKAKEKTLGMQNLTTQINNVIGKGKNVVAGINADFFNTQIGQSVGPQVCDEEILTGYDDYYSKYRYPVFIIDKNKKASITTMSFNGSMSVKNNEGQTISINIDTVNRYDQYENIKFNVYNQLIVLTPNYNSTGVIETSKYAPCDYLTVVTNVKDTTGEELKGGLKLGREYEGTVQELGRGVGQVTIPKNGVVLASNGSKAGWVGNNLKQGNTVKFKANFNVPNIKDAISSYNYLVKDDKTLSAEDMINGGVSRELVNNRYPRTALGLTKDNKLLAVVLEKNYNSEELSEGATLPELAEIMKKLGATVALNFDGGGSTQMNVKKYNSNSLEVVNNPTDGRERSISNSIVFVNKANKSEKIRNINIDEKIFIFKNSSYKFNLWGEDINCYSYDFDSNKKKIKWISDEKIGKFDKEGIFKSSLNSGKGKVNVEIDGIKDFSEVNVVDKIDEFKLNSSSIMYLFKDDVVTFKPSAETKDGQKIIIDNNSIKWFVKGNIGTIDEKGVLEINVKEGSGEVVAEAGGKTSSIKIEVGKNSVVIEDFEKQDNSLYEVTGFVGGDGQFTTEKAFKGTSSFKLNYDYDAKWTRQYNGTINIIPKGNDEKYTAAVLPKKIGLTVYGDGQAPWLRGIVTDGNGQKVVVDFTKSINWKDKWVDVYANIPQDLKLPIKLEYFYLVETNKDLHYNGTIYFDDLRFLYSN